MRIAVAYEQETGEVAEREVFSQAPCFKIYTEDDGVVFADIMDSPADGCAHVTAFLAELGVQLVICGSLTEEERDALFQANIAAFPGAYGPADDLVLALLENRLAYGQDEGGCGGSCGSCGGGCGEGGSCGCGDGDCGCGGHA